MEALEKRLNIMDSTAFSLCMDSEIPILVFNMQEPGSILRAVRGERIGTLVR
jgi:uridylate kinase